MTNYEGHFEKLFEDIQEVQDSIQLMSKKVVTIENHMVSRLTLDDLTSVKSTELKKVLGIGDDKLTELVENGTLVPVKTGTHYRFNLLQVSHGLEIPSLYYKAIAMKFDDDWSKRNLPFQNSDYIKYQKNGIEPTFLAQLSWMLEVEGKRVERGEIAESPLLSRFKKDFTKFIK